MNLVIFGASGGTGQALVQQALDRGHTVTAFVRKAARMRIKHGRLKLAVGNVLDYRTVEAAIAGQDAVLSALGHKRWLIKTSILSQGYQNVAAMTKCRVQRFVCETSLGVGDSRGRLRTLYTFFLIPLLLYFYFQDEGTAREVHHAKQPGLDHCSSGRADQRQTDWCSSRRQGHRKPLVHAQDFAGRRRVFHALRAKG